MKRPPSPDGLTKYIRTLVMVVAGEGIGKHLFQEV
jgi:hypothetical protein